MAIFATAENDAFHSSTLSANTRYKQEMVRDYGSYFLKFFWMSCAYYKHSVFSSSPASYFGEYFFVKRLAIGVFNSLKVLATFVRS